MFLTMKVNPTLGIDLSRHLKFSQHETWRAYARGRFVHDFGQGEVAAAAAQLWLEDPDAFEHRVAADPAFAPHRRAVRSV